VIDVYTWTTPNGRKITILLEELGVPYRVIPVDIGKDEQFAPDFLAISPNNKIPAIVDQETGQALMESGAIMLYLAEKYGRFRGGGERDRRDVLQWLMWQVAGFGPMLGQAHQFLKYNPGKAPFAEERYRNEARRLYGVLDRRLAGREFVTSAYSIADIAIWPWVSRFEWQQVDLAQYHHVHRWYLDVLARPAVEKGYHLPHFVSDIPRPQ
jgi:GST-like protein